MDDGGFGFGVGDEVTKCGDEGPNMKCGDKLWCWGRSYGIGDEA